MPHNIVQQHAIFMDLMYVPLVLFLTELGLDAQKMFILGILLVTDMMSGVTKAYIMKTPITYERLVAGILAKVFILIIPIVLAFLAIIVVDVNLNHYLKYVVSSLAVAECYSILGNIVTIRSRNKIEEQDLVSIAIRGIRTFMEKLLLGFRQDK